jgi:endo-1,4-beta-D-glucanase Y
MDRLQASVPFKRFRRSPKAIRTVVTLTLTLAACLQGGCRTEQAWPLWESYTHSALDPQGRIIDHTAGDHTTSEGQAYGMFFALVANDRTRFEKILHWTEENLAAGDLSLRLPAWSWGRSPEGSWKVLDQNPASDADLWIAYSLMEAGRLWRDPRYQKLGATMASRIAQQEIVFIPSLGATLLSGPQGFHPDSGTWVLNPSYMPPSLLTYFASTMPQGPWGAVLASLHPILSQGSGGGFAMDWVTAGGNLSPSPSPAQLATGNPAAHALGSYDAIRVYLWLGIADQDTPGVHELLADLPGMADYLKQHPTPPQLVDENGAILDPNSPVGFSAAVIPYLHALGMKSVEKSQSDRIASMKDQTTGLYGHEAAYYDQNLALFANGWAEQRFRFDREGRLKVKWR